MNAGCWVEGYDNGERARLLEVREGLASGWPAGLCAQCLLDWATRDSIDPAEAPGGRRSGARHLVDALAFGRVVKEPSLVDVAELENLMSAYGGDLTRLMRPLIQAGKLTPTDLFRREFESDMKAAEAASAKARSSSKSLDASFSSVEPATKQTTRP